MNAKHVHSGQAGSGLPAPRSEGPGEVDDEWQKLSPPMRQAIQLSWESFRAGNLGIGAVVADPTGQILARGRNCLIRPSPGGGDRLFGTSIAHAEMNALARISYTTDYGGGLHLYTTLQPCLQCLGAITLSAVRSVEVLAPDPLYRGLEGIRDLIYFNRDQWPQIRHHEVSRWAVFTLLLRTYIGSTTPFGAVGWDEALPSLASMSRTLYVSGHMTHLIADHSEAPDAVRELWPQLGDGMRDVLRVASATTQLDPSTSD